MASFTNRITTTVDLVTGNASRSLDAFKTKIGEAEGAWGKVKASASGALDLIKANALIVGPAVGAALAKGAQVAITAASDLEESANALTVTYGDNADALAEVGASAADNMGLSKTAFNEAAVAFAGFADKIAGEGGDVVGTVEDLTQRAADFASVMNLDVSEALRIFQSTLAGETEAIRRYGIDVSAAAITQHALAEGLVESKSEMTEAIKVQARYSLLMQETDKFAGDFANTSDGLANGQRVLNARLENLAATVGEVLVPILADAVEEANNLTRSLEGLLGPLPTVVGWMQRLGDVGGPQRGAETLINVYRDLGANLIGLSDGIGDFSEKVAENEQLQRVAAATAGDYGTAQDEVNAAIRLGIADVEEHNAAVRATGEQYGDTSEIIQAAIDEVTPKLEEQAQAAQAWRDTVTGSLEAASESFFDFAADAETSAADYRQAMIDASLAELNWAANLQTIIDAGAPREFVEELIGMGAQGATLVQELAENGDELDATLDVWNAHTEEGTAEMVATLEAVPTKAEQALAPIEDVGVGAIRSATSAMRTEAEQKAPPVGEALGEGTERGIRNAAQGVIDAAVGLVQGALEAAQRYANIFSPSKLFADEIGEPIGDGVAEGIWATEDEVADALIGVLEDAHDNALDEVDEFVEAAQDRYAAIWDQIGDRFATRNLEQAVGDAQAAIVAAQNELVGLRDDRLSAVLRGEDEATIAGIDADIAALESDIANSLATRLQRAFRRLFEAQFDELLAAGNFDRISELGLAGGLTAGEIQTLVSAGQAANAAVLSGNTQAGMLQAGFLAGQDTINAAFPGVPGTLNPIVVQFLGDLYGALPDDIVRQLAVLIPQIQQEYS